MNFDRDINLFDKYVKENYDFNNKLINSKYIHTLNVVKIIIKLCQKMNLNSEDTKLAFYLGLFHDLGRFKEVIRQNIFNNLKFDHGGYSNKILFNDGFIKNFDILEKDYLLIRKAIYFHNKKDLPDNLSDRELFFCELLRDADRIDIFRVLGSMNENKFLFERVSKESLIDDFYEGKTIDIKDLYTRADRVILRFSFVKLLKIESRELLNELGYFDDYVKAIKVGDNIAELFNELVEEVNRVLKGEKNDVRKKI